MGQVLIFRCGSICSGSVALVPDPVLTPQLTQAVGT